MKKSVLFGLILSIFHCPVFCKDYNVQYPGSEDSLYVIEKVYLHVDRVSYYPGNDIWLKAYLIDASDRFLSDHSTNLHVELISPENKIIDSRILRLDNGLGNGDFHLSENLGSGIYRIRAYTNYMRNFGEELFFNRKITIINSSDALKEFPDSIFYNESDLRIDFFPEGGSLVDNIRSVVAFKAIDDYGYGHNVSGKISSSTGDVVAEFKSTHNGMGIFSIKPVPGVKYFAMLNNQDGSMTEYELPESSPEGFVISIIKNETHQLTLKISTNSGTLPLTPDHDLSLVVSARNKPFKTYFIRLQSLNSSLIIPTDDLPDGIVALTLTGLNNIPFCERLVYIQHEDDERVLVETDRKEYNQRDSVSLKISFSDGSSIVHDAFLSLSATDNLFTDNSSLYSTTISSWFLLESDIRGPVEGPSYYFDPSNPDRLNDLDLLLLTQGWRDFEWKYKTIGYPPEYGFAISGRVRKKFTDTPVANSTVSIGIFNGEKPMIASILTDSSGRFRVEDVKVNGDAKIIASVTDDKDRLNGWLVLDSVSYSAAYVNPISDRKKLSVISDQFVNNDIKEEKLHTYIQYSEIRESLNKKYKLSDTIYVGEVKITAKRQDSHKLARDQSVQYLRTSWIDREYVVTPESAIYNNISNLLKTRLHINVKTSYGNVLYYNELETSASSSSFMFSENPIVLLNGMEVGIETVEFLPVEWVERVDYLKPRNAIIIWGIRGKNGVVSVILKDDYYKRKNNIVFHSVNVRFSGYNEPRVFYSPKHHTTLESDYKPDQRTTLFWQPNIKIKNNQDIKMNYYNADNSAIVKVTVEGITTGGIPLTATTEYTVK